MDDRSDSPGFDDSPDHEENAGNGYGVRFDCEQMANLVDGEPDRRQRKEPEEEETKEILCFGSRTWNTIGKVIDTGGNCTEHDEDALATDPRLNAIPDTGHDTSIEDWP